MYIMNEYLAYLLHLVLPIKENQTGDVSKLG